MKYTCKELQKAHYCGGKFYEVHVSLGRWAKVGETFDGRTVKHKRCYHTGRAIENAYFDNADEAFQFAETWRKKILTHLEGKKVDYRNSGTSLYQPFTEAELMRNPLGKNEDYWHDYRFLEVLPYSYSISVCNMIMIYKH